MSGYKQLPVPDMEQWSVDQVLAVYDLCQAVSAALMNRYEDFFAAQHVVLELLRQRPSSDVRVVVHVAILVQLVDEKCAEKMHLWLRLSFGHTIYGTLRQ